MLKRVKLTNSGPARILEMPEIGPRLNVLTGDNGLGKTFLLDIIWYVLSRTWPQDLNPELTTGHMARPINPKKAATIEFSASGKTRLDVEQLIRFSRADQSWVFPQSKKLMPGLVIYAQVDGSFAVWDPARNYSAKKLDPEHGRVPAYIFNTQEVWDGLPRESTGQKLCNGMIADWASWQRENGDAFRWFKKVLEALSPTPSETLLPGKTFARMGLTDSRDIPTLATPYGQEVPILHASAGVKRASLLAYLLVWTWTEHQRASALLGQDTTNQVILLVDEIEAHLHPKWQRQIVPALLNTVSELSTTAEVQLVAATHSPLVMASVEPLFDTSLDAWYDLDLEKGEVMLRRRDFEKHGDAEGWLLSEAFDLASTRPLEYEKLVSEASALINASAPDVSAIVAMNNELAALPVTDEFLFRWRYICRQKGWLS